MTQNVLPYDWSTHWDALRAIPEGTVEWVAAARQLDVEYIVEYAAAFLKIAQDRGWDAEKALEGAKGCAADACMGGYEDDIPPFTQALIDIRDLEAEWSPAARWRGFSSSPR